MSLSVLLQHLVPQKALSAVVRHATRWTFAPWKNFLIRRIVRSYDVDLDEAANPDPSAYPHFNAFFTRALKPGARPLAQSAAAIACPADGRVSRSGPVTAGRILQAKGRDYSVEELLGDATAAKDYADGGFLTVYLSPRDYHRLHMPIDGELVETVHVPGRLFSVAPFAVEGIDRVFARNERLVCHFRNERGPFVVVLVGAMLVSGIETVWGGVEVPPYATTIARRDWRGRGIRLPRGAEFGRFNMGSTAIVLVPPALGGFDPGLEPERPVRMGEAIGRLADVRS